jgi:G3E family GTPase
MPAVAVSPVRTAASRIPVVLVTGFLGSGKTSFLKRLLRREAWRDSLVVVNEFGEVALDHLLMEGAAEQVVPLGAGCVCCTRREDLSLTLLDLHRRRRLGGVAQFSRILVETTGLADPAPALQTFAVDAALASAYRLARIVTVVDVTQILGQTAQFPEALRQVALADALVLAKQDLSSAAEIEIVRDYLRRVNPGAPIVAADEDCDAFLVVDRHGAVPIWSLTHGDAPAHSEISTFSLTRPHPFPSREAVQGFFETLARLRGPDLLRVKAFVAIAGAKAPLVCHGVHHVFYPLEELPLWPEGITASRLVFIVRSLPERSVAALLDAFLDPGLTGRNN